MKIDIDDNYLQACGELLIKNKLIIALTSSGGSETAEKPVGTIFLYSINAHQVLINERIVFLGSPEEKYVRRSNY